MTREVNHSRVLVIDDNVSIHDDFRRVLEGAKGSALADAHAALFGEALAVASPRFLVECATQGEEGFAAATAARAAGRPFQVAFVDMRMPPGWDGLETTARILAGDPELSVVICTAFSEATVSQIHARLGPTERVLILKKPFDPAEVLQLASALSEGWHLRRSLATYTVELERLVRQRTAEITSALLHDRLTGLPNRILFEERLEGAIARRKQQPDSQFAVVLIDLDRFKLVNDTHGHAWGDLLLIEAAERLQASLRGCDQLAFEGTSARLGGDEFLVLLENLKGERDATTVAERMLSALARPFVINGQSLRVTASVGIALADGSRTADDIIRDADTAMYRAKATGRSRYVLFGREMHDEVAGRLQLETDLRAAIENGGFCLHYQPVVAIADGSLVGFEALLRWCDPKPGNPPIFPVIALAEETGLIHPLGLWCLQEAGAQLVRWQAPHLSVNVNLSRCQLIDPALPDVIARVIEETVGSPSRLIIEITESGVLENPTEAREALKRLSDMGVRVYLDDFGTGYSSVSCLHELPLNGIKIDRSFLANVCEDPRRAAVVEAILRMASACDLAVVAEGVESARQLELLGSLGCGYAQGYHVGRPLEADRAGTLAALSLRG